MRARLLALSCALGATTAVLSGASAPDVTGATRGGSGVLVVRVGYTAFENPQTVTSDSTLHSILRYLQHVSTQSGGKPWRTPVSFEVSVGNYYQVFSWFRRGQVDAAIVSPFLAHLLERDNQALSVLEFVEHCQEGGHQPLVAASGDRSQTPLAVYDEYLRRLFDIARSASSAADGAIRMKSLLQRFRVNFVAHLSSSGFVMPVLYAEHWLRHNAKPLLGEDSPEVRRFWQLYFDHARFALHHGVQAPEPGIVDIYFSYSGRAESRRARDRTTGRLVRWQRYSASGQPADSADAPECQLRGAPAPTIPNDVLVVRQSLLREIFGVGRIDRALLGEQLLREPDRVRGETQLFASDAGYRGVRWFSDVTHANFRQLVDRVFSRRAGNRELAARYVRWFENERFEFTIDETVGLLRLDQMNTGSSRLSLVLSGGGVKSLYQTTLLDRLYGADGGAPALRSYDANAVVSVPLTREGPMVVNSVIGTSGGAMLAFFAAQMPPHAADTIREPISLAKLLGDVSGRTLFPPADLPRVLSVVAVLGILFLALSIARVKVKSLRAHARETALEKDCPWTILVLQIAIVVAGTVVIARTRTGFVESARGVEAVLYACLVATSHLAISCIGGRRHFVRMWGSHRPLAQMSVLAVGFGLFMLVAAFAVIRLTSGASDPEGVLWTAPLLATGGLWFMSAAIVTAAAAGMFGLQLQWDRVCSYGRALTTTAAVVLIAYAVVLAAVAGGQTSSLELTGRFWLWLGGAAGAASLGLIMVTTHGRGRVAGYFREGVHELTRDRRGAVTTTLAGSMTLIAAIALGCWIITVAPAIYGNNYARQALTDAGDRLSRATSEHAFNSNLIVTGTLLRETSCPGAPQPIRAGHLYFCFGGALGCGASNDGAWQAFDRPRPARALDAVFASGSPFPVFSAHRTHLRNGCVVQLVDGGYTHNVPLEAAALADARQVLVVNASPNDAELEAQEAAASIVGGTSIRNWTSQLVQFGSRILGFMFARAQELDRSVGANMVVASLSPAPENGGWPSLLDFTKPTRARMVDEAERDITQRRRIGRIESWGFPLISAFLTPDDRPLRRRGWTPEAEAVVKKVLDAAGPRTVVALDMDNTILRGDIGDAVFLKMITDFRYAGDRREFWSLFPNQQAAAELQRYWMRFTGSPKAARLTGYLSPDTWSGDFADYVVLFLRQYEEIYSGPGGPPRAYGWVVQLLDGLSRESVAEMVRELWAVEMKRPTIPIRIHSTKYGDIEIQGGLRIHDEMKTLVDELHRRGAEVWIVTASGEWIAHHVADLLRIPRERVAGIRLRSAGTFGQLELPLTYGDGKATVLRQRRGTQPLLSIGDSIGDLAMLDDAAHAIVIDRGKIPTEDIAVSWSTQPIELLKPITVP